MQYGGKITDDLDRRLFKAYTETWMGPSALASSFCFNPGVPMQGISHFKYIVPDSQEVRTHSKLASMVSWSPNHSTAVINRPRTKGGS